MKKEDFLSILSPARKLKIEGKFDEALPYYKDVYQTFVKQYIKSDFFPEVEREYTECLILSNNPVFSFEKSERYNKLMLYNTSFKTIENRKYNSTQTISKNPYPFSLRVLPITHVFKKGKWMGYQLFEVEMIDPNYIIQMVINTPDLSDNLDLAVYQNFFLSDFRIRNVDFFNAIEANYIKIEAMNEWEHRLFMAEIEYDQYDPRGEGSNY